MVTFSLHTKLACILLQAKLFVCSLLHTKKPPHRSDGAAVSFIGVKRKFKKRKSV